MDDYLSAPHQDGDLDVSDISRKRMGLHYAAPDGSRRTFDLYYPEAGEGPFPLIVNISGGGWYYGHPTSIHLGRSVHTSVARGYALASIACTSSREKKFPYQIQEARCALRHLKKNARTLSLDPGFTALWSSSSGAHLSLLTALTRGDPYFDVPGGDRVSDRVDAVAAVYPCCRLDATAEDFYAIGLKPVNYRSGPRCAESIFLGALVEDSPELCRLAAPITHVHPDMPPVMVLHGTADTVIPYTYTVEFVRRCREVAGGDRVRSYIIPGAGHSDPRFKSEEMCGRILDFLDQVRLRQPAGGGV